MLQASDGFDEGFCRTLAGQLLHLPRQQADFTAPEILSPSFRQNFDNILFGTKMTGAGSLPWHILQGVS